MTTGSDLIRALLAGHTTDELWAGDCRSDPRMWDYHSDDEETWKEQQVRHAIVARICLTCPMVVSCRADLAAQTQPVSGVWAGVVLSGNGAAGPVRRDRGAAA